MMVFKALILFSACLIIGLGLFVVIESMQEPQIDKKTPQGEADKPKTVIYIDGRTIK